MGQARRPFAPSLDRIDSSGGYTRDNTRLVCQAVNFALNAFGEDIFREVVLAAASFDPEAVRPAGAIAPEEPGPEAERERKRRYIDRVVEEAPRILAQRGGFTAKAQMRAELRRRYGGQDGGRCRAGAVLQRPDLPWPGAGVRMRGSHPSPP